MIYPKKEAIRAYRAKDGIAAQLRMDAASAALIVLAHDRQKIRDGEAFTASFKADTALTTGKIDLLIVTPNTDVLAHLLYDIDVEGEADILLYEAVTATAGDAVVAYNRNRNSANAATVVVTSTPTEITEGTTIIRQHHLIAGGKIRSDRELILKKNTKYLLRIANETGAANFMAVNLDWLEHDDIV